MNEVYAACSPSSSPCDVQCGCETDQDCANCSCTSENDNEGHTLWCAPKEDCRGGGTCEGQKIVCDSGEVPQACGGGCSITNNVYGMEVANPAHQITVSCTRDSAYTRSCDVAKTVTEPASCGVTISDGKDDYLRCALMSDDLDRYGYVQTSPASQFQNCDCGGDCDWTLSSVAPTPTLAPPGPIYPTCSSLSVSSIVTVGSQVELSAQVSDLDGTIREVGFFYAPVGSNYCATDPNPWQFISVGSAGANNTWYTTWDADVDPGEYWVVANVTDNDGLSCSGNPTDCGYDNWTTCHNCRQKVTVEEPPACPTCPATITASYVRQSGGQNYNIDLHWADVENEQGWNVYRCEGLVCDPQSDDDPIVTLDASSHSYVDTNRDNGFPAGTNLVYLVTPYHPDCSEPPKCPKAAVSIPAPATPTPAPPGPVYPTCSGFSVSDDNVPVGGTMTLTAQPSHSDGTISKVDFFYIPIMAGIDYCAADDWIPIGTDRSSSGGWTMNWDTDSVLTDKHDFDQGDYYVAANVVDSLGLGCGGNPVSCPPLENWTRCPSCSYQVGISESVPQVTCNKVGIYNDKWQVENYPSVGETVNLLVDGSCEGQGGSACWLAMAKFKIYLNGQFQEEIDTELSHSNPDGFYTQYTIPDDGHFRVEAWVWNRDAGWH